MFFLVAAAKPQQRRASSKSLRLRRKRCFLGVAGGFAASNTQKRIFGGGEAAPEPPIGDDFDLALERR
jgi:hypothetical protein